MTGTVAGPGARVVCIRGAMGEVDLCLFQAVNDVTAKQGVMMDMWLQVDEIILEA